MDRKTENNEFHHERKSGRKFSANQLRDEIDRR